MNNNNDDFMDGVITAVVLGCAAYGAYKIVEGITKSPEQRMLENLGRDLRAIDAGYARDVYEIPYQEDDDEV